MKTDRFITFFDAVIAIIMTVLVLKIPQPISPSFEAIYELRFMYFAYLISFLIIFNAWYNNHNLFKIVENVNHKTLWLFGGFTFILTLLPYFTLYLAENPFSILPETCYGLIYLLTHLFYYLSLKEIEEYNKENKKLKELLKTGGWVNLPIVLIIIGFIITYTINPLGIITCCLLSIVLWVFINRQGINNKEVLEDGI